MATPAPSSVKALIQTLSIAVQGRSGWVRGGHVPIEVELPVFKLSGLDTPPGHGGRALLVEPETQGTMFAPS